MALGDTVIIAGPYTTFFNGVYCGICLGDDGVPTIQQAFKGQAIDNTDRYGRATIDVLNLGTDYEARFVCQEYRPGSVFAFAPHVGAILGRQGTIGQLAYSNFAAPLVLSVIAGTSAVNNPNTLTAAKATIAPGSTGALRFGPMARTVPIRLLLLLYLDAFNLPVNYTQG